MANATLAPVAVQGTRALSALETSVVGILRGGDQYSTDLSIRKWQLRERLLDAGFTVERGIEVHTRTGKRNGRHHGRVTIAARSPDGQVVAIDDGRSTPKLKSLEKMLAARRVIVAFGDGHRATPAALLIAVHAALPAVVAQDVVIFGLLGAS